MWKIKRYSGSLDKATVKSGPGAVPHRALGLRGPGSSPLSGLSMSLRVEGTINTMLGKGVRLFCLFQHSKGLGPRLYEIKSGWQRCRGDLPVPGGFGSILCIDHTSLYIL